MSLPNDKLFPFSPLAPALMEGNVVLALNGYYCQFLPLAAAINSTGLWSSNSRG